MKIGRHYSDDELIQWIKTGQALDKPVSYLYAEHFENLTHFVRKNKGSQQDAEDVFQETVLVFVELVQQHKFRGESSIKTFLYAIARHAWLNELKKRDRVFVKDTEHYYASDQATEDLQTALIKNESKRKVLEFIEQLGDVCRKILVYYYYDDFSMREIYEQMHFENEQVVRNQKYKCMKKLVDWLERNPNLKHTLKELLTYGTE